MPRFGLNDNQPLDSVCQDQPTVPSVWGLGRLPSLKSWQPCQRYPTGYDCQVWRLHLSTLPMTVVGQLLGSKVNTCDEMWLCILATDRIFEDTTSTTISFGMVIEDSKWSVFCNQLVHSSPDFLRCMAKELLPYRIPFGLITCMWQFSGNKCLRIKSRSVAQLV